MSSTQPKPELEESRRLPSGGGSVPGPGFAARDLSDALHVLLQASATLLAEPDLQAVLHRILELARQLIQADAYAVWRYDEDSKEWRVLASHGLSAAYLAGSVIPGTGISELENAPIVAPDVQLLPLLEHRRQGYTAEGIKSLLALPLRIQGRNVGTITFYFRQARELQAGELQVAALLANLAAAGISTAELYQQQVSLRQEAEGQQRRASFLAEASGVLGSSLEFGITLQRVAELVVPEIADWCAAFLVNDAGTVERTAVAHRDPRKIALATEFHAKYPPLLSSGSAIAMVIETGEEQYFPEVGEASLARVQDPERLRMIRELGMKSLLIVPMCSRDRVLGALLFVMAESNRVLSPADLELAKVLAARAAVAIDNARLFRQVQEQLQERARTEAALVKTERLATAGRLAATIAHEINNPLEAVTNLLYLAKSAPARESRRYMIMAEEELARIAHITKMTLGFYRDTAAPSAVEVGDLVHEVLSLYEIKLRAKDLFVRTAVQGPQAVFGSKGELRQVISNLVANAIDVLSAGGVLTLSATPTDGAVEIRVRDSGPGIPPDHVSHIFEPFFTTKAELGTGLGLWVTRQIVEKHGGTIAVETGPAGTCFTVTLPAAEHFSSQKSA